MQPPPDGEGDETQKTVRFGYSASPPSDLNGDGAIDGVDVALVVDALGQAVMSVFLDDDGEGVGVFDSSGAPVDAYFPHSAGACGPICCCKKDGSPCESCSCEACHGGPGGYPEPCPPDEYPCEPNPCDSDPCSAQCDTAPCNPDYGGDPCAPGCEDSGFPCDFGDPCDSDPFGRECPTAPCNGDCGGVLIPIGVEGRNKQIIDRVAQQRFVRYASW